MSWAGVMMGLRGGRALMRASRLARIMAFIRAFSVASFLGLGGFFSLATLVGLVEAFIENTEGETGFCFTDTGIFRGLLDIK
jgi:hypothetical protein